MKSVIYQVTLALSLTLTACTCLSWSTRLSWECNIPPTDNQTLVQPSSSITPIIQIDGTISMQGFVKIRDSEYIQTLQLLDRVAKSTFSNSEPQYYRFGTERRKEGSFEEAKKESFYDRNFPDAFLEKALTPLDKDSSEKLSIIVTDFYRENQDIKPVIEGFKNYLQQDYAVGILAIKSQFNGDVEDVFLTDQDFSYQGIRPFYVILLGKYKNVAYLFEQLKSRNSSLIKPENFLVFNSKLVKKVSSFDIKQEYAELAYGVERIPEIYNSSILELELKNKSFIERLLINNQAVGQQISYPVNYPDKKTHEMITYNPLPYTLPIQTRLDVESCLYNQESKNFDCQTKKSSNRSQFIEIPNLKAEPEKQTISFTTKIIESNIQNRLEKVTVNVYPSQTELPSWVKDWSFGEEDKNETKDYFGFRTYNLYQILSDLNTVTTNEIISSKENYVIGRFCFVIQRK